MDVLSSLSQVATASAMLLSVLGMTPTSNANVLAMREMSLENRYAYEPVNQVFRDNILLAIAYMENRVKESPNWEDVEKPFSFDFMLEPGETFAFHDDVLEPYRQKVKKTTNAHFNTQEGFKSDGYLFGDGVCHLASLMYWAAKDANLEAKAPTNHDFAVIPDIPKEHGVSIYSIPNQVGRNAMQNLYITNNKDNTVVFHFEHDKKKVKVSVQLL